MYSGRFFSEAFLKFQEAFGEVSQPFFVEKIGKRRGEEGGKGGEEKLKSVYWKNEFCDHKNVFLQNKLFLPADSNFSCGGTKKIIIRALWVSSSPQGFSLSFQDFFSYLPPPNPLESPEIKDFWEFFSSSFGEKKRQDVLLGRFFREILLEFQQLFGEVSQAVSMEKI